MKNELLIKKCASCGALVKVIEDCTNENCGLQCCGKEMQLLVPNSVDAAVEKHVPTYKIIEDEIFVTVNHVMEKEHFIEWICLVADNKEYFVRLFPEQNAECRFPYIENSVIYAYCNKHGLWKKDVE